MKNKGVPEVFGRAWEFIKKNKYVAVVLLVGFVLILLPTRSSGSAQQTGSGTDTQTDFSLSAQETRIAEALSKIDGAGKVTVVLTLKTGMEQVYARDETSSTDSSVRDGETQNKTDASSTTVIVSSGSSTQKPVTVKVIYPVYQGALVVCEGADSGTVRLSVIKAVSGLTGLSTDKIVVTKMNKS